MNDVELIQLLEKMRSIMIAVATGGPRIDEINSEYRRLYQDAGRELQLRGLTFNLPYKDLWEWYGRWRSGDLPSYQSRRIFITDMINPIIDNIRRRQVGLGPRLEEPTGWVKVDRAVGEVRQRLAAANFEEQFQVVGLICREILISAAQAVYDPQLHPPTDGTAPSATDSKRMLTDYFSAQLPGESFKIVRRHARASVDLAVELQHRRTATFRDAALCLEATTSVINVIAIVSGRRDPL